MSHLALVKTKRFHHSFNANYCLKWLESQGFRVLSVKNDEVTPRIIIQRTTLCDKLEDAHQVYERSLHEEHRYMEVLRFGCEIRWGAI